MGKYGRVSQVRWGDEVEQARWIAERLDSWDRHVAAMFIPRGYDAYVRLLHPAGAQEPEPHPVRWARMADWSGLQLRPDSQLEDVALPLDERPGPRPWDWGPREGTLDSDDLLSLIDVLRQHTGDQRCFFCIWDGYGWDRKVLLTTVSEASGEVLPDRIPEEVRDGRRVQLPHRNYFLYEGRLDDATAWMDSEGQSPNLWWPEDRSWCVATELDFAWTYLAGTQQLASDALADPRLEALPVQPDEPLHHLDDRLLSAATEAARELISAGQVTITTGIGTLRAWFGPSKTLS